MMAAGQIPVLVLKEGTTRGKGREAQRNNIAAAKAISDAVRTTLGPKGMDKMLVDSLGDIVITNDGATILKEIDIEHPIGKILVEVAKAQDEACRDGTTTAVILTGELLKLAEELIDQKIHPTIIANGYRMAAERACNFLDAFTEDVSREDTELLKNIAITAMLSKSARGSKEILADIAVKAGKAILEKRQEDLFVADLNNVKVDKKVGGAIDDTTLIDGIILDKERAHPGMPLRVKDAKIALINSALEIKKTEVDASIKIEDHKMLHKFRMQEERTLKEMADKLQQVGANVVISQKGIDDLVLHYLAKAGIYGVKSASKSDVERLARAAGGKIVTNLKDLTSADLGTAGQVEERKIAEDKMTFVTGCKGARAVSILIRGGSDQVISEVDRSLHDALGVVVDVLEDGKIVPGGGACEVELSRELRNYASTVGGREQLAIEAFASAVEIVPRTLAENAGLNPIDILISLRKAHKRGQKSAGINLNTGKITDMNAENVIEPLRVIKQAIKSAADAAVMILRIDDVIAAKKTEEAKPPAGGGPGAPPGAPCGMPPEYGGMGF